MLEVVEPACLVPRERTRRRAVRQMAKAIQEFVVEGFIRVLAKHRAARDRVVVADAIPAAPFPKEGVKVCEDRDSPHPFRQVATALHRGCPSVDQGRRHRCEFGELGEVPDWASWPTPPCGLRSSEEQDLEEPLVEITKGEFCRSVAGLS